MIVAEYSNSTNTTSRTLAAQARPVVYVSQSPSGMWHWNRRNHPGSCAGQSKERYLTEQAALEAAAEIATSAGATLKVTPSQQAIIIGYWWRQGHTAFFANRHVAEMGNVHMRRGWIGAAEDTLAAMEADAKPGYDADVSPSPTLEEALVAQEWAVAEQIAANTRILAGMVR